MVFILWNYYIVQTLNNIIPISLSKNILVKKNDKNWFSDVALEQSNHPS